MTGITSYGAYIPKYRLSAEVIAQVWGKRGGKDERSVANYDEDSLTMAVEAGADCLVPGNRDGLTGLYFASTTSPYREKQCASIVAAALDLPASLATIDIANSLRAGTNALRTAVDSVKSGGSALVIASDSRLGFPQTSQELAFGDAAAALVVGNSGVIAEIEDSFTVSDDITDVWRKDDDEFVRSWEDRWVIMYGYDRNIRAAVSGLLKKTSSKPGDFAKVVMYGPDARSHDAAAKALGFAATQLQDPLFGKVGNSGAAHALLLLCAALEQAKPGERILVASYGDGADAFSFRITDEIARARKPLGVHGNLAARRPLTSYGKFLTFHKQLDQPEELMRVFPAATVMWRSRKWALRGHASKCRKCGTVAFPIQRVCFNCRSKDDFEEVRLTDKKGKVFTFSIDNLAGTPDPPVTQTVLESEEGSARVYCLMTDCEASDVKVGMPVEFTFRRFHELGGFVNYYWKCRPVRG
ncbi:MAG: hydroxymethylglutaryl-CoA synthase family protein [Chloroflexi bacterium]|nr:hydroxymethylglutaryl-CoA synthase family protein [Chloroflexota bacterium]